MYSDIKASLLYIRQGDRLPIEKDNQERQHKDERTEIFKFAVKVMTESTLHVLNMCGKTPQDLDFLLPHQANIRIIELACKKLGLKSEQVLVNIQRYGNMSSAAIPVLLDEALQDGKIKSGDLLALVAFGAGLTWGSAVLRW